MKRNQFCACEYPDDQSGTQQTVNADNYIVCGSCDRPIRHSCATPDLQEVRFEEDNAFQFERRAPTFAQPINPWSRDAFNGGSSRICSYPKGCPEWLVAKRTRCLDDLADLQRLLDKIRGSANEQKEAYEAAFRQIAGAYKEIGHLEQLLERIHPGFDLLTLPAAPDRCEFVRRARAFQTSRPSYYTEALSHAA